MLLYIILVYWQLLAPSYANGKGVPMLSFRIGVMMHVCPSAGPMRGVVVALRPGSREVSKTIAKVHV